MKKSALIIGTNQTETRFLSEAELPECARLNRKQTLASSEVGGTIQDEEDRQLAEALQNSQSEASGSQQ